ncbi:MAG: hypothetical protein ACD_3C00161G0002 [uncultured bacterium (gcode 4)]|uniref:Prepilin-type N-terminal cleavage/methylation domain-containing protein n=1 Tax=uncultured bacterium (gcode 4) TaxID=1234023 RepID=K2GWM0_9BACT|nr:MAG: hypothetical protein ACD_3C00161G0002 [uncultured bacterium (gcode 4)]
MNQTKNKAFTLVELIVVIVILAILATIAFLSFSSQSGSARDSARLSDTVNIRKWLELRQAIGWSIPLPANPKAYTWWVTATGVSGVTITEWTVNNSILSTLSTGIKDPSWTEYRYSTISQWWQPLYYQLALELENPTSMRENVINPFLAFNEDIASADAVSSKVVQLKWSYMFDPSLPSLFILSGSTSSASWWIYNPDLCFALGWSSTNTFSNKEDCISKKDMNLKDYDSSLVWYWDMETTSWWLLKDLSGNGNDGVGSGSIISMPNSALTWGIIGRWLNFNSWNNDCVWINQTNSLSGTPMTFSLKTKMKSNPFPVMSRIMAFSIDSANWYTITAYNWITWNPNLYESFVFQSTINWNQYWWGMWANKYVFWSWYDLTWIYDWKNTVFYINWVKIQGWPAGLSIPPKYLTLFLWCRYDYAYYNWIIDEVKIYNRALSNSEIIQQAKSAWF